MFPQLENAVIDWNDQHPSSSQFEDVYFDRVNGLAESDFVFIQKNRLRERFAAINAGIATHFTIAETGFGCGLNFLLVWSLWEEIVQRSDVCLHFISVERWPLTHTDLKRSHAAWPSLTTFSQALLEQYPAAVRGLHRILLGQGRVRLSLALGDAEEQFSRMMFSADAWFLDGFAPRKNPEMWTPRLFQILAERSHQDTSLSTFSSAGAIRRGLQEVGFHMEKVAGFGSKWDMLAGRFQHQESAPQIPATFADTPWFLPPAHSPQQNTRIIVIGAGLAGAHVAWNLAQRGRVVSVYDCKGVAQEASGNPQGVLYTKLGIEFSTQTRLQLQSLTFAQRLLAQLDMEEPGRFWQGCGVLQLADTPAEVARQQKFLERNQFPSQLLSAVTALEASAIAGQKVDFGGLHFPRSGIVKPQELCKALLQKAAVEVRQAYVEDIQYHETSGQWLLFDAEGRVIDRSAIVVLANATASCKLTPGASLPFKNIRGQITRFPVENFPLNSAVCGEGYVAPPLDGMLCTGATFQHRNNDQSPSISDHHANLAQLSRLLPESKVVVSQINESDLQARVGFRCSTPDYLPAIGPLHNALAIEEAWQTSAHTLAATEALESLYWPGLYISAGHGSKGLATAPLAGELLADIICGQPLCVESDLFATLTPIRFAVKRLRRGNLLNSN